METEVVTSLTAYGPGYIDEDLKDLEKVVGLPARQTAETCIHAIRWYQNGRAGM